MYGTIHRHDIAMTEHDKLDRALGEVFFTLLLFAIAAILSIFYSVAVGTLTIFFGKWIYDKDIRTHFHLSQYLCLPLTYIVALGVGVTTWFLAHTSLLFEGQPLVPVPLSVLVTLFIAHLGDEWAEPKITLEDEVRGRLIDREIFSEIQQAQNAIIRGLEARLSPSEPFRCANATADEIRAAGTRKKIKPEVIEFVVKAHTTRRFSEVLADEYKLSVAAINRRKQRWTKLIDD